MPQMADMTSAARSPLQKLRQVPLGSGRARPLDGDRHGQLADGGAVLGTQVAACPVDVGYQIELLGDPNQGADIPMSRVPTVRVAARSATGAAVAGPSTI